MRVLIIDDNAHARQLAKVVLATLGMSDVRECADGVTALREMAHWEPELVLVDYEMRPMDGVEFTRRLRAAGQSWSSTPVMMMTGHTDRAHVTTAQAAGVDGFVVKPFSVESLASRIQRVLDGRGRRDRASSKAVMI